MPTSEQGWAYEHRFPSDSDQAHQVIEELISAMEKDDWPGRDMFHVQMALEEAIVNAIEHGNKRDFSKFVTVQFRLHEDRAEIHIVDEGDGFNPETLPDPTEDERLDQPRGRGVHLIKSLMSEVEYNSKGNEVKMLKLKSQPTEAN